MTPKMKQIRYKMEEIWLQSLVIVPLEIEFRRYFFMNEKQRQVRKRKQLKRLIMLWGVLGIVGLVAVVYMVMNWLVKVFAGNVKEREESAEIPEYVWMQDDGIEGENRENDSWEEVLSGGAMWESENGVLHVMPEDMGMFQDCQKLYEENKTLLVLVNKEHALEDASYENNLRNICNGRLQASKALYGDLVDLLAAAGEDGYQYWIASAYRSRERQQELVDEDVARYMAQGMSKQEALAKTYEQTMPAGKSEHETGLALDILCSENLNMDETQAKEPGNQWLVEHAHEFGFILRYPKDKEEITGISYEPWHFRYVGKEAAAFLREYDLTLEEFWELLEVEEK